MANKQVIRQWVDALRSGQYEQGTGGLANGSRGTVKYCCLGVLSELAYQAGVTERTDDGSGGFYYDSNGGYLPATAAQWAGIPCAWGHTDVDLGGGATAACLNDDGHSFGEIADIIEETFLGEENG